jgi:hypothetical protein
MRRRLGTRMVLLIRTYDRYDTSLIQVVYEVSVAYLVVLFLVQALGLCLLAVFEVSGLFLLAVYLFLEDIET